MSRPDAPRNPIPRYPTPGGSRTPHIERYFTQCGLGFDHVAQDEIGARVAGLGLVELVAEGGECWVRLGAVTGSVQDALPPGAPGACPR